MEHQKFLDVESSLKMKKMISTVVTRRSKESAKKRKNIVIEEIQHIKERKHHTTRVGLSKQGLWPK